MSSPKLPFILVRKYWMPKSSSAIEMLINNMAILFDPEKMSFIIISKN
jgi:hypothetical protein